MNGKRNIFFQPGEGYKELLKKQTNKPSNKPTQITDLGKAVGFIIICMIHVTGVIWNLKAIRSGSMVYKQVKTEYLEFSWFPPTASMGLR